MNNVELFDLCNDLEVPHISYSNCKETWERWYREGKDTCIHSNGYVSVDYPECKEESITVKEWIVTDTTVDSVNDVDINIYHLISKIAIPNYKLYFIDLKDDHQLVSGIEL